MISLTSDKHSPFKQLGPITNLDTRGTTQGARGTTQGTRDQGARAWSSRPHPSGEVAAVSPSLPPLPPSLSPSDPAPHPPSKGGARKKVGVLKYLTHPHTRFPPGKLIIYIHL